MATNIIQIWSAIIQTQLIELLHKPNVRLTGRPEVQSAQKERIMTIIMASKMESERPTENASASPRSLTFTTKI